MTLNDPSTRLRFYILLVGIIILWFMPNGYWRDMIFCAVAALLSIITTVTALAARSNRNFSSPKTIWHICASIYISTIFLLALVGVFTDNSYQPLLFLGVFVAIGVQAALK